MTIYWTNDALDHVEAIRDLLSITSPKYAEMVVTELFDRVRPLATLPRIGPIYQKAGLPQIRELLVRSYRIVYYVGRTQIDIIAVLDQKRR